MNYFFVTGDSSGIGLALRKEILEDSNNFVFGIARSKRESSKNYQAIQLDLSSESALSNFEFPDIEEASNVILVNNAGQVGAIKPLFEQSAEEIRKTYELNTIAPPILISKLIRKYKNLNILIINISSGAATSPIQGWATYCSSKAGLDMLTKTLIEDIKFRELKNIQVYSVSPGVIDTKMQVDIRGSKEGDFQRLEQFKDLKSENQLVQPEATAKLIYKIFSEPKFYPEAFINLREYY